MTTGDAARTDPHDWHVPTLAEVFELCAAYPDGGPIFLDTKLPRGAPEVARRMAAQYLEQFVRFPDVAERALIGCPDAAMLAAIKGAFAEAPAWAGFRGFALDHEELSAFFLGGEVEEATPLRGAGDNAWLSIGAPYKPLSAGDFEDLVVLVRRTMETLRAPGPHEGKRLCVWTIDEEAQMRALAAVGPDVILTDRPAKLAAVLDEQYGPRGNDPRRPRAMCHRGGPDGSGAPENTLPLIELGLRTGEGIEFDICASLDGAVVFHDNDPEELGAVLRRSGSHVGQFKPVFRDGGGAGGRDLANLRLDQLTVAEVQASYGYALDEKGALSTVASTVGALGRLIRDRFD